MAGGRQHARSDIVDTYRARACARQRDVVGGVARTVVVVTHRQATERAHVATHGRELSDVYCIACRTARRHTGDLAGTHIHLAERGLRRGEAERRVPGLGTYGGHRTRTQCHAVGVGR